MLDSFITDEMMIGKDQSMKKEGLWTTKEIKDRGSWLGVLLTTKALLQWKSNGRKRETSNRTSSQLMCFKRRKSRHTNGLPSPKKDIFKKKKI